jgi:predicted aminopeptidase
LVSQKKDSIFHSLKIDLCNTNCLGKNLPKTDGEDFELNNAYFAPINAYYSLVPIFHNMLIRCNNNFEQFFGEIEELKKLPFKERQQKLESLKSLSN